MLASLASPSGCPHLANCCLAFWPPCLSMPGQKHTKSHKYSNAPSKVLIQTTLLSIVLSADCWQLEGIVRDWQTTYLREGRGETDRQTNQTKILRKDISERLSFIWISRSVMNSRRALRTLIGWNFVRIDGPPRKPCLALSKADEKTELFWAHYSFNSSCGRNLRARKDGASSRVTTRRRRIDGKICGKCGGWVAFM